MSVKSEPFYWLTCDEPGCGVKSTEDSEYAAWSDLQQARQDAEDGDWQRYEGRDYCQMHRRTLCAECDEREAVDSESELCEECYIAAASGPTPAVSS